MESQGLDAKTVILPDGTRAHWFGSPAAEKVLLFFHGGGYLMYAVKGHFHLIHECLRTVEQQGGKLAVLFLSYDVSLQAPYPRQLQQASALLQYALKVLNKRPEQLYLAGDSAGGNLALALLSHILHPHPRVEPVHLPGKISGVALLSPWVTFDTSAESMQTNRYRDVLAVPALESWAAMFQGSAPSDPYQEPLKAPKDWWLGLPANKVLVIAGADELFVDDIQEFAAQLSGTHEDVEFYVVPGEAHDHLILEFLMNEKRTKQRDIYEKWLCQTVQM
ncbi:hypothetical protein ASPBRDRAFT_201253 [Aspergillus brasiliensis CBS 101740]|uniref:Alpha/beta hydrolase fold-3 domain-containing protein n=1 Tax=Aspergillus brasiliensis (strain CBS 101740 / IMI 381727 / IBT 21946) TaxID=767769 RepID=A0A1L9U3B2_ASPBC|nr:hypothetical protein ASPBRDRAFT_201253 [Aspergillus brasiliensis CBS 101740]